MTQLMIEAVGLKKSFNRRTVFTGLSFTLRPGESLAVSGRNGAGKSTLLKVLSGLLSPSAGTVNLSAGGKQCPQVDWYKFVGFVSPYLQLYEEFTAWENLEFAIDVRRMPRQPDAMEELLSYVGLIERRNDLVRTFSSGMKQRLKYAWALIHDPGILVFDEPTANLDAEGRTLVRTLIEKRRRQGIVIFATNELEEREWADRTLDLDGLPSEPQAKNPDRR